ncbi:MAG TPA: hypothetical protein VMD09_08235 [Solirubrobacteraceae bacterium]|nr:hypothetical protein [Solirubrobacteraceae bacterium]
MLFTRLGLIATAAACLLALAGPAQGATSTFRARIGPALGLVPPVNRQGQLIAHDVASGAQTPAVYHGGPVMSGGVTVHTIFWDPVGHPFQGSPGAGIPTYPGLIEQFFTDVGADDGSSGACTSSDCNVFTIERQYGSGTTVGGVSPGAYNVSYNPATDAVNDANPYPPQADQCASPSGTAVCLTDQEVRAEIDNVIQGTPGTPRGLTNLWIVFLPPGVDECVGPGECGTNAFAAYHSVSDLRAHGVTIYAVAIDPIIETPVGPGADPEGFPDAEVTVDAISHETNEAITDPEGNGWMDPNGMEVADKCETGPQVGTPLGFASDGSPYNQVINGHQYLLQEIWSDASEGCVQSSTTTTTQLPLPEVSLRQFNPVLTGNVNRPSGGGIRVQVSLLRVGLSGRPVTVARAGTVTAGDGSWRVSLGNHAPGDDRDEIDVDYSGTNAPTPSHQVIRTGNGGNAFTEAGWLGWTAMDEGSLASNGPGGSTLSLAPCFQTGTLGFTFDGVSSPASPNQLCDTETDAESTPTSHIGPRDTLTWTSNDNRAFNAPAAPTPNLLGGLVSLTVPVGEAGSVSALQNPLTTFTPGGFPSCIADLEFQEVACTGLVPGERYTVIDRRERFRSVADNTGLVVVPLRIHRGDSVSLSNGSRSLTTLHVAHLKVKILGEETTVAGGTCQAGDYFGPPLASPSLTVAAGLPSDPTDPTTGGVALTGQVCPTNGHAAGLPSTNIAQTDDRSGGVTETEVPDIEDTSPIEGETMYGHFIALAESGLALPTGDVLPTDVVTRISLTIYSATGAKVLTLRNVDTLRGSVVPALVPGRYAALWTLTDFNGDTRLIGTRFVEQRGRPGSGPRANVRCAHSGGRRIRCTVSFPAYSQVRGTVRMRLSRGGTIVGLGHAGVVRGRAIVTLSELIAPSSGSWHATLVLSGPRIEPVTTQAAVRGL